MVIFLYLFYQKNDKMYAKNISPNQPILDEQGYINLIREALKRVKERYFIVKSNPKPGGFQRERVFCYELYHQMRLLHQDTGEIQINGEIDKSGNTDFEELHSNPDFIFHEPSEHKNNKIVIEVKGIINDDKKGVEAIKKDFRTLLFFINKRKVKYETGVFILYRYNFQEFKNMFKETLMEFVKGKKNRNIYIITIKSFGQEPELSHIKDWFQ